MTFETSAPEVVALYLRLFLNPPFFVFVFVYFKYHVKAPIEIQFCITQELLVSACACVIISVMEHYTVFTRRSKERSEVDPRLQEEGMMNLNRKSIAVTGSVI